MYSTMSQFFSIIALMILAAGGLDIYAQTECNAHGWTGYLSGGLLLGSMIPNMVWVWSRRPSGGREQRFGEDTAMIVKGSLFIWIAMFMAGLFFSGVRAQASATKICTDGSPWHSLCSPLHPPIWFQRARNLIVMCKEIKFMLLI